MNCFSRIIYIYGTCDRDHENWNSVTQKQENCTLLAFPDIEMIYGNSKESVMHRQAEK